MPSKPDKPKVELPEPEELVKLEVWCEHIFSLKPYEWQLKVWRDVEPKNCRVALRAANGSGKTSTCAAPIAAWNAMTAPDSTTVVTSGVMRQVREQFWPALRRLVEPHVKEWGIEMTMNTMTFGRTGSRIVGFTASDTFKFEGFHRTGPGDNLLVIVDEAKSINDDIFIAIERMQPSRLLMQSSPGPAAGAFYKAWGGEKEYWKKHVVQYKDCPHLLRLKVTLADGTTIPWADSVIGKYGINAPQTKSMIFAEWMSDDTELLVCPLHWYDRCREFPPSKSGNERALGIDVAAGGDENVVAYREGNSVKIIEAWRDRDTFQAAVKVGSIIKRLGIVPEDCYLDVGGMGVGFADVLSNMGMEVNRVNFGGKAYENESYLNRGTEMWVLAARRIEESKIILPDDDELRSQFTTRRYQYKGAKTRLEQKDDMRLRGLKSPDRADAVVMAMVGSKAMDSVNERTPYGETPMDKLMQEFERRTNEENECVEGIDCGG